MDQLGLYNEALTRAGERNLSSLTENVEARRYLDRVWNQGAVIDNLLEESDWNFAMRSVELEPDPNLNPVWGYRSVFQIPEDSIRTSGVYRDESMRVPLRDYSEEGKYWYSNDQRLYVQYVSNDNSYGKDLGRWPPSFSDYMAAYLAYRIAPRLKNGSDMEYLEKQLKKEKTNAQAKDSLKTPSKPLPEGSWLRSRYGWYGRSRHNGYR